MIKTLLKFTNDNQSELKDFWNQNLTHLFADETEEWVNWILGTFRLAVQGIPAPNCMFAEKALSPVETIIALDEIAMWFRIFVMQSKSKEVLCEVSEEIDRAFMRMRERGMNEVLPEAKTALFSDSNLLRSINNLSQEMLQQHTEARIFSVIAQGLEQFGLQIAVLKVDLETKIGSMHFTNHNDAVKQIFYQAAHRSHTGDFKLLIPKDSRLENVIKNQESELFSPNDDLISALLNTADPTLISALQTKIGSTNTILASGIIDKELKAILTVSGDQITENEVPVISLFANQMAIAMKNAELYREASQRAEQLAGLNALAKLSLMEYSVSELLQQAVPIFEQLLKFDRISLIMEKEDGYHLYSYQDVFNYKILPLSMFSEKSSFRNLMSNPKPVIFKDFNPDKGKLVKVLMKEGLQSAVSYPVIFDGQVIGLINMGSKKPNAYTQADLADLQIIVDQITPQIYNSLLYQRISDNEQKYRALFEVSVDAIFVLNNDGIIRDLNTAAITMLGWTSEEIIGRPFLSFFPKEDEEEFELIGKRLMFLDIEHLRARFKVANGEIIDIELNTRNLDFEDDALQVIVRDITEQQKIERELKFMGTHDMLTGLYNRNYFEIEMQRYGASRMFPISVIVIDLDGLKKTNDELGHAKGDLLLKRTAQVLKSVFRAEDIVARWGGDEFAVLLPLVDYKAAEMIVKRIRNELNIVNAESKDDALVLAFSIGLATAKQGDNLDTVLKQADSMMYEEKYLKRGQG